MYYLPRRYVLMVPGSAMTSDMASLLPIADRIHVYETNSSSSDELLHSAGAVVCEDTHESRPHIPTVKITDTIHGIAKNSEGYDSATEPEAIATAILRLSCTAA